MPYNRRKDWLEAATKYARCGWPVVPMHGLKKTGGCTCEDARCTVPGEHAWMENWLQEATLRTSDLAFYSECSVARNVGIVTGEPSGLAALVAGTDDAAAYVKHHEARVEPFGPGPKIACSQRGVVWLFERPEELDRLPDEVEIDDGLTLLLGTHLLRMPAHVRGAYTLNHLPTRWLSPMPKPGVLPRLPEWLLQDAGLIDRGAARAAATAPSRHDVEAIRQRQPDAPRPALKSPTPPPINCGGQDTQAPPDPGPPETSEDAGSHHLERRPHHSPLPPLPFRFGNEYGADLPAPTVAGPWVRSRTLTLLQGAPKSGTTTFLLHLAQAVFRSRSFLGHSTQRSPVLYLTAQSHDSFRVSLAQSIMRPCPAISDLCALHREDVGDHSWRSLMREVVGRAVAIGARLLIVDGLDRFVTLGSGGTPSVEAILDEVAEATTAGLAVVAAMHRLDPASAPAYYGPLVRAVDQRLIFAPSQRGDATMRELRAYSRFSDTPALAHLRYDVHTRNYRAVRPPASARACRPVAPADPTSNVGDRIAALYSLSTEEPSHLGDGASTASIPYAVETRSFSGDGASGQFSIRSVDVEARA